MFEKTLEEARKWKKTYETIVILSKEKKHFEHLF